MATGINKENLAIVLEKLQNAIGKEWVSNDPATLASYSRDFTIVPGRWPNIVVLPGSTEDVQKIIKIASRARGSSGSDGYRLCRQGVCRT